jgi:hypothetical protein
MVKRSARRRSNKEDTLTWSIRVLQGHLRQCNGYIVRSRQVLDYVDAYQRPSRGVGQIVSHEKRSERDPRLVSIHRLSSIVIVVANTLPGFASSI